jgi:hypothetical protein
VAMIIAIILYNDHCEVANAPHGVLVHVQRPTWHKKGGTQAEDTRRDGQRLKANRAPSAQARGTAEVGEGRGGATVAGVGVFGKVLGLHEASAVDGEQARLGPLLRLRKLRIELCLFDRGPPQRKCN